MEVKVARVDVGLSAEGEGRRGVGGGCGKLTAVNSPFWVSVAIRGPDISLESDLVYVLFRVCVCV